MVLSQIAKIDNNLVLSYIILWIINIILSLLVVVYLIFRLWIKEDSNKMKEIKMFYYNLLTWFLFILLVAISNICTISFQYFIKDEEIARIIERIAVITINTGFFFKIIFAEYALRKMEFYKGYFFTVFATINLIIFVSIPPTTYKSIMFLVYFLLIWVLLLYSFLPILYFYLAYKTTGENRADAIKIAFGVLFLSGGLLAQPINLYIFSGLSEIFDLLILATYIISPTLLIISTLLIFEGIREKK